MTEVVLHTDVGGMCATREASCQHSERVRRQGYPQKAVDNQAATVHKQAASSQDRGEIPEVHNVFWRPRRVVRRMSRHAVENPALRHVWLTWPSAGAYADAVMPAPGPTCFYRTERRAIHPPRRFPCRSVPSSPITAAVPRCTASASACARALVVRSSPRVAARVAQSSPRSSGAVSASSHRRRR